MNKLGVPFLVFVAWVSSCKGSENDDSGHGNTAASESQASDGEDTGTATATMDSSATTTMGTGSTSGADGTCDPWHRGRYADCIDDDGNVDNKACMYLGTGMSVGTLNCLTSAGMSATGVCAIIGCEDDSDCFAPPANGDAPSVCLPGIVMGGESACVLDCSTGQTCPDDMTCQNGVCFSAASVGDVVRTSAFDDLVVLRRSPTEFGQEATEVPKERVVEVGLCDRVHHPHVRPSFCLANQPASGSK